MDKYEKRRLRLIQLRDDYCNGNASMLARKIEREPSYVSRMLWPEGKAGRKRIADDMIEIIEKAFDLPRGWMDDIVAEPSNVSYVGPYKKSSSYPVISSVQAGSWCEAIEPYTLKDIDLWLESDAHVQGDAFWLLVDGDSMTSPVGLSIPEGTFVLFDTGREPINGSLVIAKLSESNEATFKKLVIDGGQKYLKGLNPQWPVIQVNGNCRIIGVGIETKMRLI
ncbi:LexA family protein [Pluralibacter gergoviae]|uniref:LexA family protein n=1 Tax=Pluralibacter gergoviae TaxID=61647 RepID=UPI000A94F571|nr:S24 family peptidase [Pluralibacter gergoviae]